MSMTLVTGAAGYLGGRICEHLSNMGHKVTALCSKPLAENELWRDNLEDIIVGDIRDEKTLEKLFSKDFENVIHLVSLDHKASDNTPEIISSVNVMPTWKLLEGFEKIGTVKKFIYMSTLQVYGKIPSKTITEAYIPKPLNKYGLTHLLSETIVNHFDSTSDMSCINIRLSNSYGSPIFRDNNCWWLVINDLCRSAIEEQKIILLSDGSPQRDFIHSSDVCGAIEILLKNQDFKNTDNTYNLSSESTLTISELEKIVKKEYSLKYGVDIPIVLPSSISVETAEISSSQSRFLIDNTKLKSLGFSIKTSLEYGINELFEYVENNRVAS